MREEKVEIKALMNVYGKVLKLSVSLDYALFSMTQKKRKKSRKEFKSYRIDAQKFKFVDEYNEYLERLLRPPAS